MGLKIGLIGLPNVGKSTLFNALLKKRVALSANYPFATIEPNVGVVAVPDERLMRLAELVAKEEDMIPQEILKQVQDDDSGQARMTEETKKYFPPVVPAVVEFVDIAGLVKGASTGAGLGNQFLSHIREVDAIIHVIRDFEDPSTSLGQAPIIREGSENPDSDKLVIETELGLADLQTIEKLVAVQEKEAKVAKDPLENKKLEILNVIKKNLEEGKILGHYEMGPFDSAQGLRDDRLNLWFKSLPLLTIKPMLNVFNVSENEYADKLSLRSDDLKVKNHVILASEARPESAKNDSGPFDSAQGKQARVTGMDNEIVISAKLEEDLADYSDEEKKEYLHELGIEQTGLERLIIKAYDLLGLISFLTAGKKEVRAWTIKKGAKAPEAAGVIHTDFEKGFIRAQVIGYEKLIEAGSLAEAKKKGWLRAEGKEYVVQDGDVVEFLVSN